MTTFLLSPQHFISPNITIPFLLCRQRQTQQLISILIGYLKASLSKIDKSDFVSGSVSSVVFSLPIDQVNRVINSGQAQPGNDDDWMGLGGVGVTKTIDGIISRINYLLIGGARERKRYHRRFCLLTNFHDDTQNNNSISLEHLQRPHVFNHSIFSWPSKNSRRRSVSLSHLMQCI